ncbi:outer membrane protein assembly factor BamB [Pontibacter ummariensis]|uniref:Outer membrane protein assembly factor BamB, contains PQQ-like beta-propeller repeat n=1 Tax=Pontibacter ummariensis TaxID=1610492 RepID=A0A239D5W7_9BACT|nr:PQQ-binding-like beta-propeller repeat protein [Pontibacter ummariensis]PRY14243.1 outer membrane protein assembly factor BamB [Pontibacter ummariensis]SNS27234.1 Outer membrane protein assembly factor BamB, contains PQQ-like beta-propeller repeat [Pontibacter ummariensis]
MPLVTPDTPETKRKRNQALWIGIALFFTLAATLYIILSNSRPDSWMVHYQGIGTGSSPRMVDLNEDGVLDVVMGAGGAENSPSDTAVLAMDGATGDLLWSASGRNQVVGSALFNDVTGDGVPDVFIGGRTAELMAINGASGEVLWRFFPYDQTVNPADSGIYNFYNPVLVPDQDQDGIEDILISNGGDYTIKAYDPDRPAGKLMVISGESGKTLTQVPMPDGKETYFSVVRVRFQEDGAEEVVFGTGGETIGGNLYRVNLEDVLKGDLSGATVLATSERKGFIAPPALVELTGDGVLDVVVNVVDGRTIAINGATNEQLWSVTLPDTEIYSSPAIGYFNGDEVPDVFTNYSIGMWPMIKRSTQRMIDGKTGNVLATDTAGAFAYASPVVADLDNDGYDEVLMNVNSLVRLDPYSYNKSHISQLTVFDFHHKTKYQVGDTLFGTNVASTPWIGDADGDGKLEVVTTTIELNGKLNDIDLPSNLRVFYLKTPYKAQKEIKWGAYMGSNYDGIFRRERRTAK